MNPRTRIAVTVLATLVGALTVISVAFGTSGSGVKTAEVAARADFPDRVDAKFKFGSSEGDGLQVADAPDAGEVVVQRIVIGAGGHTGWHTHPGPVIVLVKSGALTYISANDTSCEGRTYEAGDSFVDAGQGHVHIARNLSGEDVELWAVYFDVPAGGAFRTDANDPGTCPF
jgi:quercetin dioxygenase-like cupin family protein